MMHRHAVPAQAARPNSAVADVAGRVRAHVAIRCGVPAIERLCRAGIEGLGLTPCPLPTDDSGLQALRAAPADLLVVLLMGRDPAALALCQAVGQDPAFAATRLVIVLDSGRDVDLRRTRALGADAVLPLPLDPDALARTLRPLVGAPV